MATIAPVAEVPDQRKRWPAESCTAAGSRDQRQTKNAVDSRARARTPLAGVFQPQISSFRLALAAEGKAAKTARNDTEAVRWFAAVHPLPQTRRARWEQVSGQDIQRWLAWLLARYSDACTTNQYRAPQQFFPWWAGEEDLPGPVARLRPPKVTGKLVPVFTSVDPSRLDRARPGRAFAQRRGAAVIAVVRATGIRPSELAAIRHDPDDTERSGLDLGQREITARGNNSTARIVKIGYQTARTLDRYLRARARHAQAWRP